jgi:hypothetical protein
MLRTYHYDVLWTTRWSCHWACESRERKRRKGKENLTLTGHFAYAHEGGTFICYYILSPKQHYLQSTISLILQSLGWLRNSRHPSIVCTYE